MSIIPSDGINDIQKEKFNDVASIFPDNYTIELADNMYLDKFEENGNVYATLEIGKVTTGTLRYLASSYKSKSK